MARNQFPHCGENLGSVVPLSENVTLRKLWSTRPGKHTKSYWKWWFIVDYSLSMMISHSYVSLPECIDRPLFCCSKVVAPKDWLGKSLQGQVVSILVVPRGKTSNPAFLLCQKRLISAPESSVDTPVVWVCRLSGHIPWNYHKLHMVTVSHFKKTHIRLLDHFLYQQMGHYPWNPIASVGGPSASAIIHFLEGLYSDIAHPHLKMHDLVSKCPSCVAKMGTWKKWMVIVRISTSLPFKQFQSSYGQ